MEDNKQSLTYYENRRLELLKTIEILEQAIIIIDNDRRRVRDGVNLAIEEFRREAQDVQYSIEEIKIHMERNGI